MPARAPVERELPPRLSLPMKLAKSLPVGVLTGAISGALVLGVGGRIAMRAVAVAAGNQGAFSMGGTLEIVVAAALYGAVGGLALVALGSRLGTAARGVVVGLALFGVALVASAAARSAAAAVPERATFALSLFVVLALVYGVLASAMAHYLGVRGRERGAAADADESRAVR